MIYCIDQPRTPPFPIGLVKTESDFIVRSVKIGLERWSLVVALIRWLVLMVILFLAFSDLTCHLEGGYGNRCVLVALCHLIIRTPNVELDSSESKVKFRQASNSCKRVLEGAKLAYASKTKDSITSQKIGSRDFWQIANSVLDKGKSALPPLFNGPEVLSSASDKAQLLANNFSKNSNIDDLDISLPVFIFRTNLKLDNMSITPKMVKKVITNVDSSVCGSKKLWVWSFIHTSWALQYVSERVLFSRLFEGFIGGPCI